MSPHFDRRAMTRTQEAAWLSAFATALQNVRLPDPFYTNNPTLEQYQEAAAEKADLIVSLLPLDTLPCYADKDDAETEARASGAGTSRRPCVG